jgi:hypothetical protein
MNTNVAEFPQQEDQQINNLTDIQTVADRTKSITVTKRIVAIDNGVSVERETQDTVFVRPLPFRRWLNALRHLSNIIAHIPQNNLDLSDEAQLAIWIVELLGQVPDDIIGIASLATDRPDEFFDQIDLDEGVKVILAVIEVNKDFFVQKVLPMLSEQAPNLKAAMAETFGPTA